MSIKSPERWVSAMNRGSAAFSKGDIQNAKRAFRQATKLDPKRAESWANLGMVQVELGNPEQALRSIDNAISIQQDWWQFHLSRGNALQLLGKRTEMIAAYRQAVSINRSPLTLNNYASSLRTVGDQKTAEQLYNEALRLQPDFTLARVNLATVLTELGRFDEAKQRLEALKNTTLTPAERNEVISTLVTLSEHQRLQKTIEALRVTGDVTLLAKALSDSAGDFEKIDSPLYDSIRRYAESAERFDFTSHDFKELLVLPEDWTVIEGLFMIPLIESYEQYLGIIPQLKNIGRLDGELLESNNMITAVQAAMKLGPEDFSDPIHAEAHLRHWHLLACFGINGFDPGQFKITKNTGFGKKRRADPPLAAGTLRKFFLEIYPNLSPGLPRALLILMAINDIHPFNDGNGRVALTLMNRELQWASLMPVLFTREMGYTGRLRSAMTDVRQHHDIASLLPVLLDAQEHAIKFCQGLNAGRTGK